MKNDEERLKQLEKTYMTDEERALIVSNLKDDDTKIELLNTVNVEYRGLIISSLKEDGKKIKLLNNENLSEFEKTEIIKSLKNDEEKINIIKNSKFLAQRNLEMIISSLKKDTDKIELLDIITLDYLKASIIASLESNDKKLELLNTVKDRATIVASLKNNDSKKIELLDSFTDEEDRYVIILSLSSDESKIKVISKVNKILALTVIDTFENDDNKKELLESIGNLLPQVYEKNIFGKFKHFIANIFVKITSKKAKNNTI